MIRGTTPTHSFESPIEENLIDELLITYSQRKEIIVEKAKADCDFSGKIVSVTLSQEDTLKFSHKRPVRIQVRILTTAGKALATDIIEREVKEILNEEVLE